MSENLTSEVTEVSKLVISTPKLDKAMVTIAAAANYLSVSVPTVRRMIQRGELPAVRLSPQVIRVRVADLDALGEPVANIGAFL